MSNSNPSSLGLVRTYQDARWANDLDPTGAETASDLESLEQDVQHILMQTIGSNMADLSKGVGVVNYLSGTSVQFGALPSIIDGQLAQVSRITSSHTMLQTQDDGTFLISIAIQVATSVVNLQFAVGPNGLTRA